MVRSLVGVMLLLLGKLDDLRRHLSFGLPNNAKLSVYRPQDFPCLGRDSVALTRLHVLVLNAV